MGLFSSKKKTTVGTSVSRVIEDAGLPDSVMSGTIKSIFRVGDVHEYVLDELVTSVGVRAERMYRYGRDHYTHGLPSGQFHSASKGRPQLQTILDALEGAPVVIDYANFGAPNLLHIGWMQVIAQFGYDPLTNQLPVLSVQNGATAYLHDLQVGIPKAQAEFYEEGALAQWGTPATAGTTPERPTVSGLAGNLRPMSPVILDPAATDEFVKLTYVWKGSTPFWFGETGSTLNKSTVTINITEAMAQGSSDYFHVKYMVGGVTKYWMYRMGAGTYPTLDALFGEPPTVNGTYFPFAYFRFNKQSEIGDTSTQNYKTSKKLVKYLGMDYDVVATAIDENPDIADVEQAMLIMAVPANTSDPLEQRYLFTFFDSLHNSSENQAYSPSVTSSASLGRIITGGNGTYGRRAMVIQDKRFKMVLSYQEVYKQQAAGNIAEVGKYTSGTGTEDFITQMYDSETGATVPKTNTVRYHFYRYQKAPGVYEEVLVAGLQVMYYVLGEHKVVADETDDILLIPLDYSIAQTYSIAERETLYSRSLHFVFNSAVITKVKWYQRGIFRVLLLIVAIAIAVYDGGATLGAYLGLQGAAAIIASVVINMIVGELLKIAFKLFVKVFGADLALLLAVVLIVVAGYHFLNAESLKGVPWASELLQLSNGLQNAAMEAKFGDLLADRESFTAYMEEQNKLLETANDLLSNRTAMSPFVIFGESPDAYFNRTVHSGNIGVLGIDAVASYTDIALTLPKLNDTLGEATYE